VSLPREQSMRRSIRDVPAAIIVNMAGASTP
jgi:hypothetical protein